ncbi:MAG: Gx transporter family protein [Clostridia bacterium]|nr:Gx transporter family protein [Clostridia bacterium]
MQQRFKHNTALLALLTGVGLILGYVESIIFPQGMAYGIKLGISNIVVLFSLMCLGKSNAYIIAVVKSVLSGALFSSVSAIIYSLSGVLLSVALMSFLEKRFYPDRISVIGISIAGSAAFNIGQVIVACFFTKTLFTIYVLTHMLPISIITGTVTGIITYLVLIRFKRGI